MKKITFLSFVFITTIITSAKAQYHPDIYIPALADLRSAHWLLANIPAKSWNQSDDEKAAVKKIEDIVADVADCSFNDHKDINEHSKDDEALTEHKDRLAKAEDLLNQAHETIKSSDLNHPRGLRRRSLKHINEAIALIEKVKADSK